MGKPAFRLTPFLLLLSCFLPATADKLTVIPSNEASKESFQVKSRLGWHTNLDSAKQEAARTGRLVFWVHMLGSIDGKT